MNWYEDPVYIKMCDCLEIQRDWKPKEGDWIVERFKYGNNVTVLKDGLRDSLVTGINWGDDDVLDRDISIWLPTQSQLQKMIDWEVDGLLFMVEAIQAFASIKITNTFPTWEQLWLAYLMKELYNKSWSGTTWE